jgi:hypothetical protein
MFGVQALACLLDFNACKLKLELRTGVPAAPTTSIQLFIPNFSRFVTMLNLSFEASATIQTWKPRPKLPSYGLGGKKLCHRILGG